MEVKKKCVYHRGDIVYVKDLPATADMNYVVTARQL